MSLNVLNMSSVSEVCCFPSSAISWLMETPLEFVSALGALLAMAASFPATVLGVAALDMCLLIPPFCVFNTSYVIAGENCLSDDFRG